MKFRWLIVYPFEKGVKTNHILLNESHLEGASEQAKNYSKISDISEFRAQFAPDYVNSGVSTSSAKTYGGMMSFMKLSEAAPAASASGHEENYKIASGDIEYSQSERLVQKALNRKK